MSGTPTAISASGNYKADGQFTAHLSLPGVTVDIHMDDLHDDEQIDNAYTLMENAQQAFLKTVEAVAEKVEPDLVAEWRNEKHQEG